MVKIGDVVFAKVRGWYPWPGKVMCQVTKNLYKIFFFGTNQESLLKIDNIWSAEDDTLEQFAKKYRKIKGYSHALEKMKNNPNTFAESEFDLCRHKCITCDPTKKEAGAKSSFQMEKTTHVVNVYKCLLQIESQKLQVLVKKIATPVEDDNSSTERREKELSPRLETDNEEREAVTPPMGKSSTENMELRIEAREKRRDEEEGKCKEKDRKREEMDKKRKEIDRMRKEKDRMRKEKDRKHREKERKRKEKERKRKEEERKRKEEERKRKEEERKRKEEEKKRKEGEKKREEVKKHKENERKSEEEYWPALNQMPKEKKLKRTSEQIVDYDITDSDETLDASGGTSAPSPKAAKLIPLFVRGELLEQASEKQSEVETSSHWRSRLEKLLIDAGDLEENAYGCYRIDISNTENGSEDFLLELSPLNRRVLRVEDCPNLPADVHVALSSENLAGILGGSVSPVMAYLTGKISAKGDLSKLLLFSQLSKEG